METLSFTVRTMFRHEIGIAVEWAAAEGWNPGLHDADCFHAADNDGFLIGLLHGAPVATISAVKYGDTFGFIGFYIVKPEHRGKGYGLKIWNAALARLNGRIIGLDGVASQQGNYRKSGFALAYANVRYQACGDGKPHISSSALALSTVPFDEICAYEKPFFPEERAQFLKSWVSQPGAVSLGILKNRKLSGYGVLRPCRSGYKIGPLFADTPGLAEDLFLSLKSHAPEKAPVFLDIPSVNPAAVELVKKHGMSAVFGTARMYKGEIPALDISRTFGVTSFELG